MVSTQRLKARLNQKNPAVFVRISQGICSLKPYREKDFCSAARHLIVDLFFVPEAAD
jgi:hypothetical protein